MKFDGFKGSTKGKIAGLTLITLFFYTFLTFLIFGFGGKSSFWISFSFAVLSIVLAYYISYRSIGSAKKLKDWIFSVPVLRWCAIYVAIELIIATVFMFLSAPWVIVFVVQFLLPILFLILVMPCFSQKKHIAEIKQETVTKVSYIRLLHAKLIVLIPRIEDAGLKKELEKAADLLRHSDPMSDDSLAELEQKMSNYVDEIDSLIRKKNYSEAAPLIKEMCFLIEERKQLVLAAKLIQH